MIGAEIVALAAVIIGLPLAGVWWQRRRHEIAAREREMRGAISAALSKPGHQPLDELLAVWGSEMRRDQREQLERVREDRYVSAVN